MAQFVKTGAGGFHREAMLTREHAEDDRCLQDRARQGRAGQGRAGLSPHSNTADCVAGASVKISMHHHTASHHSTAVQGNAARNPCWADAACVRVKAAGACLAGTDR